MNRELTVMILAIYKTEEEGKREETSDDPFHSHSQLDIEQILPKYRLLKHTLEIETEIDILYLPIEAEIMTSDQFFQTFRGNLEAGKNKSVKILSVRPASTRQILTKPINTK
jgi:hypothetical protein